MTVLTGVVVDDGRVLEAREATVSVFDRGFVYADAVFEVMRTYRGVPFRHRAHLERLARSCEKLGIDMPCPLDTLASEVALAHEASGQEESYLRVVITRGTAPIGLQAPSGVSPRRLVYALPLKLPPPESYERGISAYTVSVSRALDGTAAVGAKSSNYLGAVVAVREAKARGGHEAILVGPFGEVLEGATSNLFVVHEGQLLTPPEGVGVLAGITRATVFELAAELGIQSRVQMLFPPDLYRADEVFITSSIRELVPVTELDDRPVGEGRPGPLGKRLLQAYRSAAAG